jgi:hypothetical protein
MPEIPLRLQWQTFGLQYRKPDSTTTNFAWLQSILENREEPNKEREKKSFGPEPLMVSISTRATLAPFAALQMVQAASVASVRTRHQ